MSCMRSLGDDTVVSAPIARDEILVPLSSIVVRGRRLGRRLHADRGTAVAGRVALRTALGAEGAEAAIRRVVASVSSDVVISDVRRMDAVLTSALAAPAATTTLLAATAVLVLALGCVGVYGVLSFWSAPHPRLGIRFALGVRRRDAPPGW